MAFTFSKTTPTTAAVAMYELKERLKTAGWTVRASSDATTYNSTGDQITSGATGAGGFGNTNAWFRIQRPDGVAEFTFQKGSTAATIRIKYSYAAKFTGGSPGATQTPSATDETVVWGGGTDASPTYATAFSSDNTYRWNVGADSATPYGWWAGSFTNGGSNPNAAMIYDPLTGTEPTDGHIHLFYISISNSLLTTGMSVESWSSGTFKAISTVPAVTPATVLDWTALTYNSGASLTIPNSQPTNPLSSKDEVIPIIWARRVGIATPGYKGVGSLMRWTGTSRTTGSTLTYNTTRDRIIYGHVSLPWDGSVPTV